MHNLEEFGWNSFFVSQLSTSDQKGLEAARVANQQKNMFIVLTVDGAIPATVSGKFSYQSRKEVIYPVVGDWVLIKRLPGENRCVIKEVLPRTTYMSRKAPGEMAHDAIAEHVLSANMDIVIIVESLNKNFSVRRLERYLIVARGSKASVAIVLSKADLCSDINDIVDEVRSIAPDVEIIPASSITGLGMDAIRTLAKPGTTLTLLGSSGVGKSSLINVLAGEELLFTSEVRGDDDKGRHTTSHRQLVMLPNGSMIIDNPGVREIQVWADADEIADSFADIATIAHDCRFSDCTHTREPGCAVQEAVSRGELDSKRVKNYVAIQEEVHALKHRHRKTMKHRRF